MVGQYGISLVRGKQKHFLNSVEAHCPYFSVEAHMPFFALALPSGRHYLIIQPVTYSSILI